MATILLDRKKAVRKFKRFTSDSSMTEEDALVLGEKVNEALAKRYFLEKN